MITIKWHTVWSLIIVGLLELKNTIERYLHITNHHNFLTQRHLLALDMESALDTKQHKIIKQTIKYCKPINIGGYLIWYVLPSGRIHYYFNWLSLVMLSLRLIKLVCIGYEPYVVIFSMSLMWKFLGPSQISHFKLPPNINRFAVTIKKEKNPPVTQRLTKG